MERLFGLDMQLIADTLLTAISVFVLFTLASYLFFDTVRDVLKKRQDRIQSDLDTASKEKSDALCYKAEYETKLRDADREVEEILSAARKKAMQSESKIIDEAKEEAARIIARANGEIELEKKRARDEMKKEMIQIATLMAGKVVAASIDEKAQNLLIEETLNEMGDETWLS